MYYLLALAAGVIISVMVSLNGGLTAAYGAYIAAAVIHAVGVVFAFVLCLIRRQKVFRRYHAPLWAYLGGVIGVFTVYFNNYAYGRISVTSIVALGLLGQSVLSNAIDAFGLFGMEKRPVGKSAWLGAGVSLAGIAVMMDNSVDGAVAAVLVSVLAGVTVVLSRTVNARLAERTGALLGSFWNHLVGLPICVALVLILPAARVAAPVEAPPWVYLGGTLGVLAVLVFNIIVPKISAFRITLLSFVGQIFTGIVIDLICGYDISGRLFWGGLICAAGLFAGMALEQCTRRKKARNERNRGGVGEAENARPAKAHDKTDRPD